MLMLFGNILFGLSCLKYVIAPTVKFYTSLSFQIP